MHEQAFENHFYFSFYCRRNGGEEDSMVATEVAEDIKESDREATDLGWGLKGGRLPFTWLFQNMATMKDTGTNWTLHL